MQLKQDPQGQLHMLLPCIMINYNLNAYMKSLHGAAKQDSDSCDCAQISAYVGSRDDEIRLATKVFGGKGLDSVFSSVNSETHERLSN